MTMWRVWCLAAIGAAALGAASQVVGGPYVVNATSRGATVAWIVASDTVTYQAAGAAAKTSPALKVEHSGLSGLQPNTRYDYEVAAGKGWFKTPPSGVEPFRFVLYGDVRTRHDVHRRVIAAILKSGVPDLVLHTGDLVENGKDSALWATFFDIERELLRQTSFFPSLGNHERNAQEFYDFFQTRLPYYSFNWGNAHFTVIDSDLPNVSSSKIARDAFWAQQTAWLEEDLAANQKADYRFVVAHHPPFTAVERRQGDNPHMTALTPMFEKYHVTAGLFGHDHNYQHYLKNGIHYVGSGGGGAPLYDVKKPDPAITVKVASIENFVTVSVNGKTAKAQAIDIDGKLLDEFEFRAAGQ
ncbi:MAG: metallophosphoesterase [Candidatus Solibacter sp.]|jgi:3',5'-cyclic AMP phosphodiesterase CpdA